MELRRYAEILLHWWWLILLSIVLAGSTAFIASSLQQPVYQASVTLLISEAPSTTTSDYTAILTSERLARTYLQMLTSRTILDEAILRLKLHTTADILAKSINAQLVRDTQLITLSVEDTDPALAASIANTVPEVFITYNETQQASRFAESKQSLQNEINSVDAQIAAAQQQVDTLGEPQNASDQARLDRLQADLTQLRESRTGLVQSYENLRLAEAQSVSNVIVVESAQPPRAPIRPRTLLNTALAAVVGAMLAVGVAFLIEYLDDTIKTPDDLNAGVRLPTLAVLRKLSRKEMKDEVMTIAEPRSPFAESVRALRTNIQFSSVDRPLRTLLVTSAGPAEGKTMVAANLAGVLAQAGLKVVLVDGDLRRPSLHRLFNRPNRLGLTEVMLTKEAHLEQAYQATGQENLAVLTSGRLPPNPAELLASERMVQILTNLAGRADVVIIDSPPISAVTDAVVLASRVEGVILVVESGATRLKMLEQTLEQLRRVGANVIGAVMNKVEMRRGGYYYNYYYYHSYDRSDGRRPSRNGRPSRQPAASEAPTAKPQ